MLDLWTDINYLKSAYPMNASVILDGCETYIYNHLKTVRKNTFRAYQKVIYC